MSIQRPEYMSTSNKTSPKHSRLPSLKPILSRTCVYRRPGPPTFPFRLAYLAGGMQLIFWTSVAEFSWNWMKVEEGVDSETQKPNYVQAPFQRRFTYTVLAATLALGIPLGIHLYASRQVVAMFIMPGATKTLIQTNALLGKKRAFLVPTSSLKALSPAITTGPQKVFVHLKNSLFKFALEPTHITDRRLFDLLYYT